MVWRGGMWRSSSRCAARGSTGKAVEAGPEACGWKCFPRSCLFTTRRYVSTHCTAPRRHGTRTRPVGHPHREELCCWARQADGQQSQKASKRPPVLGLIDYKETPNERRFHGCTTPPNGSVTRVGTPTRGTRRPAWTSGWVCLRGSICSSICTCTCTCMHVRPWVSNMEDVPWGGR